MVAEMVVELVAIAHAVYTRSDTVVGRRLLKLSKRAMGLKF